MTLLALPHLPHDDVEVQGVVDYEEDIDKTIVSIAIFPIEGVRVCSNDMGDHECHDANNETELDPSGLWYSYI